MPIGAFISGCAGLELTSDEESFFRDAQPWGLILFKRNVETPEQVQSAHGEFPRDRRTPQRSHAHRSGRWPRAAHGPAPIGANILPPAAMASCYEKSPLDGLRAARLTARLIAEDLPALGINVDCIPVLDVPGEGSHEVIGNRAYAEIARNGDHPCPRRHGGPDERRRAPRRSSICRDMAGPASTATYPSRRDGHAGRARNRPTSRPSPPSPTRPWR